jgi:hypothetical protein
MAEKIVSPGVFTRETDLSYLPTGIAQIGAAFVGPTERGPAFLPTLVTSQAEYEQLFGTPKDYYTGFAVQQYLREAGSATIIRVAGLNGYQLGGGLVVTATSASVSQIVAILAPSSSLGANSTPFGGVNLGTGSFAVTSSAGTLIASASVFASSTASADDVFGISPFFGKAAYAAAYFDISLAGSSLANATSSHITTTFSQLDTLAGGAQDFSYSATYASTPWIKSQLFGATRYNLFRVHTLGDGDSENTRFKLQISNIKVGDTNEYGTFTLTLRGYADLDKRKEIFETYSGLTMDPSSPNYIAKRIGNRRITIDSNGKITESGEYENKSKLIRVETAEEGTIPVSSVPFANDPYSLPFKLGAANDVSVIAVAYTTASVGSSTFSSGFNFDNANNINYLKPIPTGASTGSNAEFGLDSTCGLTLSGNASADVAERNFVLAFQGGYNGQNPTIAIKKGADITSTNTQGFNCATSLTSGSAEYFKALATLSNQDEFDINMLVTPGIIREYHEPVTTRAIDICSEREDVFYIADFSGQNSDISAVVAQANAVDNNYVGIYYPWMRTNDPATNKIIPVPPSVLMAATYAQSDRLGAEWFAPAGLNRGGITGATQVLTRLTQNERDTLYENNVNPIAAFPGQGISAFGQKTLQQKASALDRINVRRLLINLKKFVASTSRFLVFEQNTPQTRQRFINTVTPYLESVQQRQGLYAFRVVMDETNNTPDVIDRNILAGSIFLQPTKTAEFIIIDFNVLPTGATFSV